LKRFLLEVGAAEEIAASRLALQVWKLVDQNSSPRSFVKNKISGFIIYSPGSTYSTVNVELPKTTLGLEIMGLARPIENDELKMT
jgi:hypothetical protein